MNINSDEPVEETMDTMSPADQSLSSQGVGTDDDDGDEVSGPRNEATITLAKTAIRTFLEAMFSLGSDI